ncbi:MAG: DNA replication/repair protein RecF [Gammaproteobacteria bacterium]|nr:DNA replication/repair protein RecF [Gammaproteobacteria bacterium]MDH3559489.1 DNA replication/repair protein RecF [Gammaproteobacteria bacterium]
MPTLATGLQRLDIGQFRNIETARLAFSPGLNLITGPNAAGKTSLLEAVYCLGRVHSFRTTDPNQLIRHGQAAFRVVGRVGLPDGRVIPVGIQRRPGNYEIHLEGRPLRRLSDLAGRFPIHLMTGDTANILSGGPRYRRQSLDWALFHVEPGYRNAWQRYARALRQRNAALRDHAPAVQVTVWDSELVSAATSLDRLRRDYLKDLSGHVARELTLLLPGKKFAIRYQSGWAKDLTLAEALKKSLDKDRSRGYTQPGPHRADYAVLVDDWPARTHYSRGQQKSIIVGFLLGQVKLQHALEVPKGIFLLDDLASELDVEYQARVLSGLAELETQVFVTAIDTRSLDLGAWPVHKRFHVEHGTIREVVQ